jgi:taurine dioxygenase
MTYTTMDVRPLAGALGAVIHGANLKDRDDSPMWQELREAFLKYRVIAIRGQDLSPADIMRVGGKFGEPCEYPFARGMEGYPFITQVIKEPDERKNFGNDWHTDTMYTPKPPRATLLYALQTPAYGGDTLYVNTAAAYAALSDGMKKLLGGLRGVASGGLKHRPQGIRAQQVNRNRGIQIINTENANDYEATHPVVRTHPDTGEKALYVSSLHTIRFEGMTEEESKPLIDWLNDHSTQPEFSCRVDWEPGQLTIWDNRCTMHYAVNDYHGNRRHMQRLIVGPETPRA